MNENEKLRVDRMLFYKRDMQKIDAVLTELLRLSSAKCALLVDKEGHMVARAGQSNSFDVDTISALVAGSFAATREMARILGEEEFTALFHQGRKDNLQLTLVGQRTILAVLFDDTTTIGMVRLYAAEAARKLTSLFRKILARGGAAPHGESLVEFHAAAASTLEDVFGE